MSKKSKNKAQNLAAQLPNESYLEKILAVFDQVRDVMLKVGYSPANMAFKKSKIEKATIQQQKEAYLWIIGFRAGCTDEYLRIRNLVPEGTWMMYEASGSRGSFEQTQMKNIKTVIRQEWVKRPTILRRFKNVQSKQRTP